MRFFVVFALVLSSCFAQTFTVSNANELREALKMSANNNQNDTLRSTEADYLNSMPWFMPGAPFL